MIIGAIREHFILAVCWPGLLLSEPVDSSAAHAFKLLDVCPRFRPTRVDSALGCASSRADTAVLPHLCSLRASPVCFHSDKERTVKEKHGARLPFVKRAGCASTELANLKINTHVCCIWSKAAIKVDKRCSFLCECCEPESQRGKRLSDIWKSPSLIPSRLKNLSGFIRGRLNLREVVIC